MRKAAQREAKKRLRAPEPHQADHALVEALAFLLRDAPSIERDGKLTDEKIASYQGILKIALDILVRRGGYDPRQSAKVLASRLKQREEHSLRHWTPHYPECELNGIEYWSDMSIENTASTPVTPSGPVPISSGMVTDKETEEVTQI